MNLHEYQRSMSFIDHGPRSLRFNIFKFHFLETAWPNGAKCYVQPSLDEWTKVWLNGPDHITKMAAMSRYVKNLKKKKKKSSSLEPKGGGPWTLVCSNGYSSTIKFVQMMTLGWPWPVLKQGQIWSLMLLYGKKVEQWMLFFFFFQKLL